MHCKLEIEKLMSHQISHLGVVERIESDCVHVRIAQTSACAACKVAGYCNAAENKEKIVDVCCDNADVYRVGQTVRVAVSGQVAAQALLWGFGLSFLLMVLVLFVVLRLTGSEGLAALSGLAVLIPYYVILWIFRDRMRKQLAFTIEVD